MHTPNAPVELPYAAEREALLHDAPDAPPCGPDLTYAADFLALEHVARGKAEQQYGDTLIPAEPPDWREVERLATLLLGRTKDLRIAVQLCRAWTRLRGLPGLAGGLLLVAELLQRHGDALHPLPEDGDDFMRANALAALDDAGGLVRDLRDADFLRSSLAELAVREAEAIVRGGVAAESGHKLTLEQLRLGVAERTRAGDTALLALPQALAAAERIRGAAEPDQGQPRVELAQLRGLLAVLAGLLPQTAVAAPAPDAAPATAATPMSTAAPASVPEQAGPLRTRDDAVVLLLQVAEFLERTEPINPAPLLIRRAARWMGMGFIDILRELSPESLAQVEAVTRGPAQSS
ncbi:type VI secretion system protein TssA [Pseudorhodoferax sp.]|uniref:type VI secretion system protein TssA n=1 Tax=Pseudorhodoferax sp. TaxID=1993553 RepID=UPI002DD6638E|nr:type VI secretion system protein TssA [Pseudorhodoferax sp.]